MVFLAETHHLFRLLCNKELCKWVIILLVKYIAQRDAVPEYNTCLFLVWTISISYHKSINIL